MKNDGKFILDGKRVKFSDYGGSSMTTKYLTTEPPLDPPEPIDYKAQSSRRDSMQRHTPRAQWELEVRQAEKAEIEAEEEELINNWRMYDALEDSLLEMEGK